MAAIFRRRAEGDRLDAGDPRAARPGTHLLLVPTETATPELVATLVRARVDDADLDLTGRARVGR